MVTRSTAGPRVPFPGPYSEVWISSGRGGAQKVVVPRPWERRWDSGSTGFLNVEVAAAVLVV